MGKLGKKSQRNQGELYEETKSLQVILSMTPTGKTRLDTVAVAFGLSRSELIEQLVRNLLNLHQLQHQLDAMHTKNLVN